MGFFQIDKEIDTKDLKLSDYNQIWTKFCFLDECGSLSDPTQNLFTLGVIKLSQPYYLSSKISYERNKRNFHDELKFNKLSKHNIDFYKFAMDSFFDTRSSSFYSYTISKKGKYFQNHFHQNP